MHLNSASAQSFYKNLTRQISFLYKCKSDPQRKKIKYLWIESSRGHWKTKKIKVYLNRTKFKIVTDCEAFHKPWIKQGSTQKSSDGHFFFKILILFSYIYLEKIAIRRRSKSKLIYVNHIQRSYTKIIAFQSTADFENHMKQAIEHSTWMIFT